MSASNSQILDQPEPLGGVKHVKPPVKPPVKPKPVVPPRPKDIVGSSNENKSPLLSPTLGPLSPTLDIPSALKISQLTGPQPYGTRRTSLKRWSSSVGEDVNQENNALSPVEKKSIDLPAKITAQPLSAPLRSLQTGPVWKGKSPFMLTTRGWGEQRMNQSKESEAVSLQSSSSVISKDTNAQKKEITALKEDSNSHSRITLEEKVVTHVQDSVTKSEKSPSMVSEDVTMGSSGVGSPNRSEEVKELKKELPGPLQSGLHFESSKQASQYDHQEEITSIESKIEEKLPSAPRESLQVQKSHQDDENEKMAIVYDNQISDERSGLGHVLVCDDDIIVKKGQVVNRGENHQLEAHVDHYDPQQIGDVIPKYTERTNISYYEQTSHHENQEPKNLSVTSGLSPPKPKERKKPSVQFIVPKADDPAEGQRSLDCTLPESQTWETKECKQEEDGNADVGRWHGEDRIEEIPVSYGQQKTDEEEKQKSAEKVEPPGYMRTQATNYKVTIEDINNDPTDYTTSHRSDLHNTIQDNIDVCQPDVQESNFHDKETKHTYEEDVPSISYTTKLNEIVERGNQHIDTNHPYHVVEDHRSFHERQPEDDPDMKNVGYMTHFAPMAQDISLRLQHENYEYTSYDSGTTYIHHDKSPIDHSEHYDVMEPSHISIESQSEEKLPSHEINIHSMEFHPPSAPTQSHEELTQYKNYESNSSKSTLGYLADLESSKSEVQLTHLEDPTYEVIESPEIRNTSDQEGGLKYYNIYSHNLQDREEIKHRVESEDHDYSHSYVEKPMYEHAESKELVHTYKPSEGLVGKVTPTKEIVQTYEPFEDEVHTYIASGEPVHTYSQYEAREYNYATSEEPVHKYAQFGEPMQDYSQTEEERYDVKKKPKYEYDQSEKLEQTYEQTEKQVPHDVQSEDSAHEKSSTQTLTYEKHMKPIYTYDELKESYPQDTQPKETEKVYEQVYEHAKETSAKYIHPEDSSENIIPQVKTESHYQQAQEEEPISKNYLLEKNISSEMPLELPNYRQAQSEEPDYRHTQTEDLDYQKTQLLEQFYKNQQPEGSNYQYKHSEESYYQEEPLDEPNYQRGHSDEPNYQRQHSDEPNYQRQHSEEQNDQETVSDEVNVGYSEQNILVYKDKGSEDPHLIKYYSEQSDEKDDQTQKEKTKVFEENNHRFTESKEEEYVNLHAVEKESGHVTSEEQDKPKSTLEKYLEQQDNNSFPEEYHYKDDSSSEIYNNELLPKEQKLEYTQKEEPKTLAAHIVESVLRNVVSEQQDRTDSKRTDKHSQFLESHTVETQDTCAENKLDKHTLNEKNINGYSELEESELSKDGSERLKLSGETLEESPLDTASDSEEIPEESFDFLEGTGILDTSLMRGRASLGKKRCHRTPAAGTCNAQEETDPEYWMFRDSTETRCSPGKVSDDDEKDETSTDCTPETSPTSVKSPTKKAGIFSGIISPSILKGRLKSRNKSSEGEATKSETKESQDPTSPGKEKSESSSHSLGWLQALKKKKKKHPK
ncbi:182 kDa tankyrase-1-binding protein [Anomaloglossus baeobatrachus]|uniref:182 kDa tankyrase-1-binding protein n=1 Tax=Anomaloglossus baeobatrachus TaxID=238106 RepID=UPI003F50C31E